MTKELVTIEGTEYVVAPNGALFDDDGNVCGFLGADVVGGDDNFIDSLMTSLHEQTEGEAGAKGRLAVGMAARRAGMAFTAPQYVALGAGALGAASIANAAKEYMAKEAAEAEADRAEARAAEMQRRVEAHRRRHGR